MFTPTAAVDPTSIENFRIFRTIFWISLRDKYNIAASTDKKESCRQRRNLARTLRDNDDVIRTLETLTGIIVHLLAVVAYAAIFRVDVGHLLISLSSISVACAFVFGNSMKTIYESVVFLFVIRPYQVLLLCGFCFCFCFCFARNLYSECFTTSLP